MAQLALALVVGIGLVSWTAWRFFGVGRSADRDPAKKRAQAQRDFEARFAAQLEENERRHGVTGHMRPPTAEEIAAVRKQFGWKD